MNDIRAKYVPPAIDQLSFNCPHCGALAQQFWFSVHAERMKKDAKPTCIDDKKLEGLTFEHIEQPEEREKWKKLAKRMAAARPFIEYDGRSVDFDVYNVSLCRCYRCDDISIWFYDRLVWPRRGEGPLPNPDLPDDVRLDYDEASSILDLSPRGAAALLRLAIQKLCGQVGGKGENLNDDIALFVKNGLDTRVQRALDVVRVIGNNAVHPGQIDLRDDRATAEKLFGLVNLIAEKMISEDKHVTEMFEDLPESAKEAIAKRDKK